MTPLDYIASLPHGESKAAALKVYNLMTPRMTKVPSTSQKEKEQVP